MSVPKAEWAKRAIIAVCVAVVATLVVSAPRSAVGEIDYDDATVWLASQHTGDVSLASGATGEILAQVEVAEPGEVIEAVPDRDGAVVVNQSTATLTRMSNAALDATETRKPPTDESRLRVWPSGDNVYLLHESTKNITMLDRDTLHEQGGIALTVDGPLGTVDDRGDLWLFDRGRSRLHQVSGTEVKQSATLDVAGGEAVLTTVAGRPVVVDRGSGSYAVVDPKDGSVGEGRIIDQMSPGQLVFAPTNAGRSPQRLHLIVPDSGSLVTCALGEDACEKLVFDRDGGDYGASPVLDGTGNLLFVADYETSEVVIIDLRSGVWKRTNPLLPAPHEFELVAAGDHVWFNDPLGADAGIIDPGGAVRPVSKFRVAEGADAGGSVADGAGGGGGQAGECSAGRSDCAEGGDAPTGKVPQPGTPGSEGTPPNGNGGSGSGSGSGAGAGSGGDGTGSNAGEQPEVVSPPPDGPAPEGPAPEGPVPEGPLGPSTEEPPAPDQKPLPPNPEVGTEQPVPPVIPTPQCGTTPSADLASFSVSATEVSVRQEVRFVNRSAAGHDALQWTFAEGGRSTAPETAWSWGTPGNKVVTLSATWCGGSVRDDFSVVVVVRAEPVLQASIGASSTTVEVGQSLTFEDRSAGEPTSWLWDFGDGTTSTDRNPAAHRWSNAGTKSVKLTVRRGEASDQTAVSIRVVSAQQPPQARFSVTKAMLAGAYDGHDFRDDSSGDVTSRSWEFGDGGRSSAANPRHRYSQAGTWTVRLTVANAAGSNTTTQQVVVAAGDVSAKPVANFTPRNATAALGEEVAFMDQSSGNPTSWEWDFLPQDPNEGGRSVANPTFHWNHPGRYRITLKVVNAVGTDTATGEILVQDQGRFRVLDALPANAERFTSHPLRVETVAGPRVAIEKLSPDSICEFTASSDGAISSRTVRMNGVGTCEVRVSQPTHELYQSASPETLRTAVGESATPQPFSVEITAPSNPLAVTAGGSVQVNWRPLTAAASDVAQLEWTTSTGQGSGVRTGAALTQPFSATFSRPGNETISLRVTHRDGRTATASIGVSVAGAGFSITRADGAGDPNQPLSFAAAPTSPGLTDARFNWEFGDGATASSGPDEIVTHRWAAAGSYTVSVTMSYSGVRTAAQTAPVTIRNAVDPPVVQIGVNGSTTPPLGSVVQLSATGTADSWQWTSSRSGALGTAQNVSITMASLAPETITLRGCKAGMCTDANPVTLDATLALDFTCVSQDDTQPGNGSGPTSPLGAAMACTASSPAAAQVTSWNWTITYVEYDFLAAGESTPVPSGRSFPGSTATGQSVERYLSYRLVQATIKLSAGVGGDVEEITKTIWWKGCG